jgi:hypothetical protein
MLGRPDGSFLAGPSAARAQPAYAYLLKSEISEGVKAERLKLIELAMNVSIYGAFTSTQRFFVCRTASQGNNRGLSVTMLTFISVLGTNDCLTSSVQPSLAVH